MAEQYGQLYREAVNKIIRRCLKIPWRVSITGTIAITASANQSFKGLVLPGALVFRGANPDFSVQEISKKDEQPLVMKVKRNFDFKWCHCNQILLLSDREEVLI